MPTNEGPTPGPWRVERPVIDGVREIVVMSNAAGDERGRSYRVAGGPTVNRLTETDAQLIAQAPALAARVAALEAALRSARNSLKAGTDMMGEIEDRCVKARLGGKQSRISPTANEWTVIRDTFLHAEGDARKALEGK